MLLAKGPCHARVAVSNGRIYEGSLPAVSLEMHGLGTAYQSNRSLMHLVSSFRHVALSTTAALFFLYGSFGRLIDTYALPMHPSEWCLEQNPSSSLIEHLWSTSISDFQLYRRDLWPIRSIFVDVWFHIVSADDDQREVTDQMIESQVWL